jgi:hypothetical protein
MKMLSLISMLFLTASALGSSLGKYNVLPFQDHNLTQNHQDQPHHPHHHFHQRRDDPVAQLLAIAPTSDTCADAPFPAECVVSSKSVVEAIVAGFARYGVATAAEQAVLLSWMAYESGDFKYNQNHYPAPGRPGQGTRAMLMPNYVQQYASSLPELQASVTAAGSDVGQVLSLVQPDQYSFASAAWFYSTQCTAPQKDAVQAGSQSGWAGFVAECVGTTVTSDRQEYWTRACQALGVSN